jgi:hypothetical protein
MESITLLNKHRALLNVTFSFKKELSLEEALKEGGFEFSAYVTNANTLGLCSERKLTQEMVDAFPEVEAFICTKTTGELGEIFAQFLIVRENLISVQPIPDLPLNEDQEEDENNDFGIPTGPLLKI